MLRECTRLDSGTVVVEIQHKAGEGPLRRRLGQRFARFLVVGGLGDGVRRLGFAGLLLVRGLVVWPEAVPGLADLAGDLLVGELRVVQFELSAAVVEKQGDLP